MYSTRRINNKIVEGNAYLHLKKDGTSPYLKGGERDTSFTWKPVGQDLPDRWRGREHFACSHNPQMPGGGDGYFRKLEYPPMLPSSDGKFKSGDPYIESETTIKPGERYVKVVKFAGKKSNEVPFGSNDISKRGEFTATIRTEQYRECLKKEQRMIENHRNFEEEDRVMKKHQAELAAKPKKFLYDIGRSMVTEFDPKSHRDKHFIIGRKDKRDVGAYRLSSREWGDGAENWKYSKPQFGPIAHVKNFFDKSHLDVPGY